MMNSRPTVGSESFWEMAALAMAGQLASCQSCLEYFYFQSKSNAIAFLESCVVGGLVTEVSLLDLCGDVGPHATPSVRGRWYDQPIFISAPRFRRKNLDAARRRIEITKRAVYNAYNLYYEVIGANDEAIDSAYFRAVREGRLRHSETARERLDVDLSPVARLRLIQDGFKALIKRKHPDRPPEERERLASGACSDYVLDSESNGSGRVPPSDRAEELEGFVEAILLDTHDLREFWDGSYGEFPSDYRDRWLRVISELISRRFSQLSDSADDEKRSQFLERIGEAVAKSLQTAGRPSFVEGLEELDEEVAALKASTIRAA